MTKITLGYILVGFGIIQLLIFLQIRRKQKQAQTQNVAASLKRLDNVSRIVQGIGLAFALIFILKGII